MIDDKLFIIITQTQRMFVTKYIKLRTHISDIYLSFATNAWVNIILCKLKGAATGNILFYKEILLDLSHFYFYVYRVQLAELWLFTGLSYQLIACSVELKS